MKMVPGILGSVAQWLEHWALNGTWYIGLGGTVVRTLGSQSRQPGFKTSCCRLEALAISFSPHRLNSGECAFTLVMTPKPS